LGLSSIRVGRRQEEKGRSDPKKKQAVLDLLILCFVPFFLLPPAFSLKFVH
jgi:hypothetical protein